MTLIRVSEAARLTGRHKVTIHRWIRDGLLDTFLEPGPRREVGIRYVDSDKVLDLSARSPEPCQGFTPEQLAIARRVCGSK